MKTVVYPGHVTESPALLGKDLDHLTSIAEVTSLFNTECAPAARAAELPRPGWTVTHRGGAGEGECALLTKDSRWHIDEQHWLQLTEGGGKGRLVHPIVAPLVVKTNPEGRVVVYTGAHMAAHLEALWRLLPLPARLKAKTLMKRSDVIGTYVKALTSWRAQTMRIAARVHADEIVVVADWNLNSQARWVRDFFAATWPGLHIRATRAPDLGKRTVGWILTTMAKKSPAEVVKTRGSDHDAGVYDLQHLNKRPVKKPAPTPDDPFEICTYNGARMDFKTKTFLQVMEKKLGYSLTVLQGCYNAGAVSASAGTHDGGGVVDLAPFEQSRKVRVARWLGGFYWHRPFNWDGHNGGEHIHGGIRNHGRLSPSAARQQDQYDAHPPTNGLASFGIDTAPHPKEPVSFSYLAAWHDING